MKRALSLILTAVMLFALVAVPVSADEAEAPAYLTMDEVLAADANALRLTHLNARDDYQLEGGRVPGETYDGTVENWSTAAGTVLVKDNSCFINVADHAANYKPGIVTWDVSAGNYNRFQCQVAAFCLHGTGVDGTDRVLNIIAIDAEGTETTIASSAVITVEADLINVTGEIPAGTVTIKAELTASDGRYYSSNCVITDAVVFNYVEPLPTIAELQATETNVLPLNHSNVSDYVLETGRGPDTVYTDYEDTPEMHATGLGTPVVYEESTFLNMSADYTPGYVAWDISGVSYAKFQCNVSTFFRHGEGVASSPRFVTVYAVDAAMNETVIATSPEWVGHIDFMPITADIPEGTVTIIVELMAAGAKHWYSSNCIITDCAVYGIASAPTLAELQATQTNVKALNHTNVDSYLLEEGRTPGTIYDNDTAETHATGLGTPVVYEESAFLNMSGASAAGHLVWDISDGSYAKFQCNVSTFYRHGDGWPGSPRFVTVYAIDADGNEEVVATSMKWEGHIDFMGITADLPEGTAKVKVEMINEPAFWANSNCIITDCAVYGEFPAPETTQPEVTDPETEPAGGEATEGEQGGGNQGGTTTEKKGCGSSMGIAALALAAVAAAPVVILRKKED